MIATYHWSATVPIRIKKYHIECALKIPNLDPDFLHNLRALALVPSGYTHVPWQKLYSYFDIWKNFDFDKALDYGCWHLNKDPRDQSPNVEIAALCMDGQGLDGIHPFTIAHAWALAGLGARLAAIKGLDPRESFKAPPELQNGPLWVFDTHGGRALQTPNWGVEGAGATSEALSKEFGYFPGSGDPDSRSDLWCLDPTYKANGLKEIPSAALNSANWMRIQTHALTMQAQVHGGFPGGLLGLDKEPT